MLLLVQRQYIKMIKTLYALVVLSTSIFAQTSQILVIYCLALAILLTVLIVSNGRLSFEVNLLCTFKLNAY